MRYYAILISDPSTGQILVPNPNTRRFVKTTPGAGVASYTSLASGTPANGVTLPGALNIELDLPISYLDTPQGQAYLRIWGVSLTEIAQKSDLNGLNIDIFAGMAKGLPLAKPQQAGLLLHGQIFQAFGNWQGTEQSLDFVVTPANVGTPDAPINGVLNWRAGIPLSQAIAQTLTAALPAYTQVIAVSPKLVLNHDEIGSYYSLVPLSQCLNEITKPILGGDYDGVHIWISGQRVIVADGTVNYNPNNSPSAPIQIAFEDMVGQPTWIGTNQVSVALVMRGDLSVGDYIKFPTGPGGQPLGSPFVLTQPQAAAPGAVASSGSAFVGTFKVTELHHFGNFRQATADAWVTMITASAVSTGTATGAPTPL